MQHNSSKVTTCGCFKMNKLIISDQSQADLHDKHITHCKIHIANLDNIAFY